MAQESAYFSCKTLLLPSCISSAIPSSHFIQALKMIRFIASLVLQVIQTWLMIAKNCFLANKRHPVVINHLGDWGFIHPHLAKKVTYLKTMWETRKPKWKRVTLFLVYYILLRLLWYGVAPVTLVGLTGSIFNQAELHSYYFTYIHFKIHTPI